MALMPEWVYLCRYDDLQDGASHGFDPAEQGQDSLFVVRQGPALYGYCNACPHINGAPMAWKQHAYLSADGRHIMCYAHGARFLLESGLCVQGPCIGQSLEPVPLQISKLGEVFALIKQ